MREILFRGKAVNLHNGSKDFVYGQYVQNRDGKMIYSDTWENGIQKHYVIEETVGQYTGLTDKNGKKIFEGDILEITSEYYNRKEKSLYKVKYHEATASWCAFAIDFIQRVPLCKNECKYYKVIGNIHDNPELLKGGVE